LLVGCNGSNEPETPPPPKPSFDVSVVETTESLKVRIVARNQENYTFGVNLEGDEIDNYISEVEFLLARLREAQEKTRTREITETK
jgi:hypothetical protein